MNQRHGEGSAAGRRWLTMHETASRHGAYRWVEHRLFELMGAWASRAETPAAARRHLFDASAQHAWHAQLWADRLPVLADVDPDALTRPVGPLLAPLIDALETPRRQGPSPHADDWPAIRFLAGAYRVVLPRLLGSYALHRLALSEVADGPSIRALGFVRRDEEAELATGDALLDALAWEGPEFAGATAAAESAALALEGLLDRSAAERDDGARSGSGAVEDLVPWPATAPDGPPDEP